MSNNNWLKAICTATLCTGMLFFLLYHKILIVHWSFPSKIFSSEHVEPVLKKTLTFFFWKNQRWNKEDAEILWHSNEAQRILYLSNRWLTFLDEEQVLEKKVTVQDACLSQPGKEAYVSFDCTPFSKNISTRQKLMLIEGLSKTLQTAGISVQTIFFLVDHAPLHDPHIDFSQGWPLKGFVE